MYIYSVDLAESMSMENVELVGVWEVKVSYISIHACMFGQQEMILCNLYVNLSAQSKSSLQVQTMGICTL